MRSRSLFCFLMVLFFFMSCKEDVLPKPTAMLRLEYPESPTQKLETPNFEFEFNTLAQLEQKNNSSLTLEYPKMKGSIFINYKKINGNLKKLISDAEKLTYEHAAKADGIQPRVFENPTDKVYGTLFMVSGDAASQAQFYVTDSTEHFLTGSIYFSTRPNYDSIYPAAVYLQEDIGRIMETIRWK